MNVSAGKCYRNFSRTKGRDENDMAIRILTSHFDNGFPQDFSARLKSIINSREKFVFVASEFYGDPAKTDRYFHLFLNMFSDVGITFVDARVVDGRMSKEQVQKEIVSADVIWLAGGDTVAQYRYFKEFEIIPHIKNTDSVVIGMSAGAINMAETAICSIASGHKSQAFYNALNLVNISVEPHFDPNNISQELLLISQKYPLVGLCDNSVIIEEKGKYELFGQIFLIKNEKIKPINHI